jgi:hypothetical protein
MSQGPYHGRCMTCGHDPSHDRALDVARGFSAEIEEVRQALSQAYLIVIGRSPAFSKTFGIKEVLVDIDNACRLLRASVAAQPAGEGATRDVREALTHDAPGAHASDRIRHTCAGERSMTDDILFRLRKEERERAEAIRLWRANACAGSIRNDDNIRTLATDAADEIARLQHLLREQPGARTPK